MTDTNKNYVQVWSEGISNPVKTVISGMNKLRSIFGAPNGDIYVADADKSGQVKRFALNDTVGVSVMTPSDSCYGLFVDINNNLYCSIDRDHQVVKQSLNSNATLLETVAGTSMYGSSPTMLRYPQGIFVDQQLTLHVADYGNDRVQRFLNNQLDGTTVAGAGVSTNTTLNGPTGVTLDADGYLFIVDSLNHRIVGSGPNGFRCLAGCAGGSGSASNQMYRPTSLGFDNHGNIFVIDSNNDRVQKFLLATNSCGEFRKRTSSTSRFYFMFLPSSYMSVV